MILKMMTGTNISAVPQEVDLHLAPDVDIDLEVELVGLNLAGPQASRRSSRR